MRFVLYHPKPLDLEGSDKTKTLQGDPSRLIDISLQYVGLTAAISVLEGVAVFVSS